MYSTQTCGHKTSSVQDCRHDAILRHVEIIEEFKHDETIHELRKAEIIQESNMIYVRDLLESRSVFLGALGRGWVRLKMFFRHY